MLPPSIHVPGGMIVFLVLLAVVAIWYQIQENRNPVTIKEINEMHFGEIVKYLNDVPVVDRGNHNLVWHAAVERGIKIWTPMTDLEETIRFYGLLENQKEVRQAKQFVVRVNRESYGSLEPQVASMVR